MNNPKSIQSEISKGLHPGGYGSTRTRYYQATGEFRAPRKGEFYLSGAVIEAWQAPNDLATEYWIAREVELRPCRNCQGTGRVVAGWAKPASSVDKPEASD